MNRLLPLAFLATATLALAACGNKGPLVRPMPAPAPQAAPAPEVAPAPLEPSAELPPPAPEEVQDAAPPAGDGNG
ncbi:MAG TPA: lipoprotein [Xanthomonadaceae bacterium]|jgi:hypothetical protein|nr:lipoprotein [Xanthomonadaceae bacterium]